MRKNNIVEFKLSDDRRSLVADECIDPIHKYRILVSINEKATDLLYRGEIYIDGEISPDLICLSFGEDTFYYMETRLFDFINVECGTLINMYEEEILDADELDKAIAIVEVLIRNSDDQQFKQFSGILLQLLQDAKEYGTIVGFYF